MKNLRTIFWKVSQKSFWILYMQRHTFKRPEGIERKVIKGEEIRKKRKTGYGKKDKMKKNRNRKKNVGRGDGEKLRGKGL